MGSSDLMPDRLKVACWNAEGIAGKEIELLQCMEKYDLDKEAIEPPK
jgi:hypothetical protein